jgi:hypothetical protein
MRITSFRIENYKSFSSPQAINVLPGFNVIVGKNNVGKTALTEALSLRFEQKPHLSQTTVPYIGATPKQFSHIHMCFEVTSEELKNILVDHISTFHVPIKENRIDDFLRTISHSIVVKCIFRSGEVTSAHIDEVGPTIDQTNIDTALSVVQFTIARPELEIKVSGSNTTAPGRETIAFKIATILRERIYCFRAERLNVGQSNIGAETNLKSDASNLPQVLHYLLSSNPRRYEKFIQYVHLIFPEITYISAPPMKESANLARIAVWTIDIGTEREDLAMPLQESGTGIGQILAILYVVISSNYPRTIIIDEPQSFLHPGAIRKLFDILKRDYPQHQYIVTTHSPTVVAAASPQSILLVRKEQAESVIDIVDVAETQNLRLFLSEIGARLSDIFGADDILWVEGATEEQCFPLILEKVAQKPLMGTAIVGVKHTGDFQGKHKGLKTLILDIYSRLSKGKGLLPPAIGFIFDKEGLTEQDQKELITFSKGKVFFLPRKMYENYLLNPSAIVWLMSHIEGFRDGVTAQEVADWLDAHGWNSEYISSSVPKSGRRDKAWFANVDGTKILKDLFTHFSEAKVAYDDKPGYGQALTKWLIENARNELDEVALFIQDILEKSEVERTQA